MKRGFYYRKTENDERCYFLSGDKKGNQWIYLGGINGDEFMSIHEPEWVTLNWMCIPTEEELKNFSYSEINPINYLVVK